MTSWLANGKARNCLTFRPVSSDPLTNDLCVTKVGWVCVHVLMHVCVHACVLLYLHLVITSHNVLVFMT